LTLHGHGNNKEIISSIFYYTMRILNNRKDKKYIQKNIS